MVTVAAAQAMGSTDFLPGQEHKSLSSSAQLVQAAVIACLASEARRFYGKMLTHNTSSLASITQYNIACRSSIMAINMLVLQHHGYPQACAARHPQHGPDHKTDFPFTIRKDRVGPSKKRWR